MYHVQLREETEDHRKGRRQHGGHKRVRRVTEARRYARPNPFRAGRRASIVRAMALKESRDIVIEASPEEILDVIADFESMPEWSEPHQSAEILTTGDDG